MKIQLIEGSFSQQEALELLTQLVHVKIRFHEQKIEHSDLEEDIKMREKRIKQLQQDLYEVRQLLNQKAGRFNINAGITINNT